MFRLKFNVDNAVFDDGDGRLNNYEIARILREIAGKIDAGEIGKPRDVFDVNGNKVGMYRLT